MRTFPTIVVGFALLFLGNAAHADTSSIQGTVIGTDGKHLANAEVRAERLDAKATALTTKTDVKGLYVFKALAPGAYAIIASAKNVKSQVNVKTRSGGLARVDFDLGRSPNNNSIVAKPANTPANIIQNPDLSRMQGRMGGNINNMSFPGH